jgi:hypothetical protein
MHLQQTMLKSHISGQPDAIRLFPNLAKPVTIRPDELRPFLAMSHPPIGSAVSRKVYQPANVP